MMKISVLLPGGWFRNINEYLFDGSGNEFSCYLFCGAVRSRSGTRLLGRSFSFPDKLEDYFISHKVKCRPSDYYMDNVLYERPKENDLIKENLSIVDIHSHPFAGDGRVEFSSDDVNWQEVSAEYFFKTRNFNGFYCFIVMGENSFDGTVCHWDRKKDQPIWNPLSEIIILDYPYRKWQNPSIAKRQSLTCNQSAVFDRQIRAFGIEGQEVMGDLTAGIAGVGGIGSIAAEGLARLGVNRFVLVDHDRVEMSNLNRFQGMTRDDAKNSLHKTVIIKRLIKGINPAARIKIVNLPVQNKKAVTQLKVCDFIILGTDNILSRAFINEFSLQYEIPLFSLGTVINIFGENDEIQDIFGEYFVMIPGDTTCCLKCAGLIDYRQVSYLLSSDNVKIEGKKRGYIDVDDITQPAVRPLNGAATEMMLSEIHNYFCGFKGRLDEGMGYDQKCNIIHRRFYLNPALDTEVDGAVIEGRNPGDGFVHMKVNGAGPWKINPAEEYQKQLLEMELNENGRAVVENYLYSLQQAAEKKNKCSLCCKKGKLGLGENEPMTKYPEPEF